MNSKKYNNYKKEVIEFIECNDLDKFISLIKQENINPFVKYNEVEIFGYYFENITINKDIINYNKIYNTNHNSSAHLLCMYHDNPNFIKAYLKYSTTQDFDKLNNEGYYPMDYLETPLLTLFINTPHYITYLKNIQPNIYQI